ncbi:MAG: hypothetical protein KAJ62_09185 [Desulfobacteraceae bacterium]|nr:hypothetical protein [Desulfobacteraceae bacterium]
MNLDDLIPFIIFLGIILFNILKRFGKKKSEIQDAEPAQKPKRKKKFWLSNLIDNMKAEIEKANLANKQQEGKQSDSIWATLSGETDSESKEPDSEPDNDLEEMISEEISEPIEQVHVLEKQKIPKASDMVWGVKKRKCKKVLNLSPSKMREAIVLSEIIAKPIGLRE